MIRKPWMFLLIISLVSTAGAAELTLEQAVEKGLERALSYRNALLNEEVSSLEKETAKKSRLFSIHSGGSYLFKSDRMEISMMPGQSVAAGSRHNFDIYAALRQPIYTGNILANSIRVKELRLAIAQKQKELEKINAAAAVKGAYFNYHLLKSKKKSSGTIIRKLSLHLERLEAHYREELVRKSDVLETRRKLQEQEISLEELNRSLASERLYFQRLCGLGIDSVEAGYMEKTPGFQAVFEQFKTGHPVPASLAEQSRLLATRGKIVKGGYLPRVSGFAELHYGKPGIDFFKNQWGVYFQGGLKVSMKLFDWNKKKRDLSVLDYEAEKVANQRDDFILEGEKRLKDLYESKASLARQGQILKNLVEITAEDVTLKEALYREQQIANTDYLDALTTGERYRARQEELVFREQMLNVLINRTAGKIFTAETGDTQANNSIKGGPAGTQEAS